MLFTVGIRQPASDASQVGLKHWYLARSTVLHHISGDVIKRPHEKKKKFVSAFRHVRFQKKQFDHVIPASPKSPVIDKLRNDAEDGDVAQAFQKIIMNAADRQKLCYMTVACGLLSAREE
jgi:hypothetical protein